MRIRPEFAHGRFPDCLPACSGVFQQFRMLFGGYVLSGGFGCFSAVYGDFRLLRVFRRFTASVQGSFLYITDNQQSTSKPPTDSPAPTEEKLSQSPPEGTLRHVTFPGPNRVCNRRRTELSENELIDAEGSYGLTRISGVFRASLQARFSYIAKNQRNTA